MLSGAKHLSYHSAPLSFRPSGASGEIFPIGLPPVIFLRHCHFDRALPTVISTARPTCASLCITCYSRCHPCHVERSETSFTLFRPLSFRPSTSHCHFDRAKRVEKSSQSACHLSFWCATVISTARFPQSFRPSVPLARHSVLHAIRDAIPVMLIGAKHLSYHSAPLSFRPSGASGEICMLVMRGTVVGICGLRRLQLRRCGELDPKGLSSRLAVAFPLPEIL